MALGKSSEEDATSKAKVEIATTRFLLNAMARCGKEWNAAARLCMQQERCVFSICRVHAVVGKCWSFDS
jgi:hypothetical protein